ncbi:MAG: hypothetical protein RIC30_20560 [Marinoscillum sp.]|uniref:hypothetical protein n=1 Tax=Marinoscillum sp. TaxID=2024838 RepID=UPI0033050340
MKNNRSIKIVSAVACLLLIPLIAMQYTDEVNWSAFDFLIAAILLLGTGFTFDLILRKVKSTPYRIAFSIALLVILLLVWMELAVGIFGTPLAGH